MTTRQERATYTTAVRLTPPLAPSMPERVRLTHEISTFLAGAIDPLPVALATQKMRRALWGYERTKNRTHRHHFRTLRGGPS